MQHIADPEDFPKAFEDALNAGDLARVASLYDDAAAIRSSSGDVAHGTGAVRGEMQKLMMAKAHITNTLRQTLRCGDTALILVDYVLEIDTPDGKRAEVRGTATNVIKHFPGKGWRMIIANPQGTG